MKRYTHSAIILLAALAIAGCTETEEFQGNPDSALQIESVSGISPFSLMQEPASRAVITGKNLPADEAAKGIGLFVTATDGTAYDGKTSGYSNVNYTYSDSKWSTATPVYLSNTTGKLYGYFPYNADATNLTAVPVESSLNGTDYLYATKQDVSFSNKSVNLEMNHALARLHLTIKKGDKYLSDCKLTKIAIESKAIDASGTMDITTGTVTAAKAADATGTVTLTGDDAVTATGIEKDILLVPASNAEGKKDLTLTLTIDGTEAKVNFTGGSGLDIRQGIQCNVTLTIEDTGIKLEVVGVGAWGDGGSQTVQVSGHTVTVKLAEEQLPDLANDLIYTPKLTGDGRVIIEALSQSQKRLECYLDGKASCTQDTKKQVERSIPPFYIIFISHVFSISNIASDVTATIGYPRPSEIQLSASSLTLYVDESLKFSATVSPDDTYNKKVTWSSSKTSVASVDVNGNVTAMAEGTADIIATTEVGGITDTCTVTVKSTEELILPGEFSVGPAENPKKVRFSRGNLYYDGIRFCIEEHQYDSTPTSDADRSTNHISHFFWCKSASESVKEKYSETGTGTNDKFFTDNDDFAVNAVSSWRTLTGGEGGEWEYLLDKRKTTYGTGELSENNRRYAEVKVNNIAGLLIFPDDFSSWPSGAGDEPQTFNTNSSNWNGKNYTAAEFQVLQDNGCVFLPAAGLRDGDNGIAFVCDVGGTGVYWSASPYGSSYAYDLYFRSRYVYPSVNDNRTRAYSVRLVTESK